MTTGIVLSTEIKEKKVIEIIKKAGFNDPVDPCLSYMHNSINTIALQVSTDTKDGGIRMEFEDWSERFPNNQNAIDILKQLYTHMPDLKYREYSFPAKKPEIPLSEFFKNQ